jgi:hypothetical protein
MAPPPDRYPNNFLPRLAGRLVSRGVPDGGVTLNEIMCEGPPLSASERDDLQLYANRTKSQIGADNRIRFFGRIGIVVLQCGLLAGGSTGCA